MSSLPKIALANAHLTLSHSHLRLVAIDPSVFGRPKRASGILRCNHTPDRTPPRGALA